MLRVAVGSGLAAVGYLLLYAAVTAGGTYALRPWDALSPTAPWPVLSGGGSSSSGGGSSSGSGSSTGSVLKDVAKLLNPLNLLNPLGPFGG